MFDRISTRYELLNTLMTAGLHRRWNKAIIAATQLEPGDRALDFACGTGSLTRDLARRVGPEGYVLGIDFSEGMLQAAKRRPAPNIEYRLGGRYRPRRRAVGELRCGDHRLRGKEHTGPGGVVLRDGPLRGTGRDGCVPGNSAADG